MLLELNFSAIEEAEKIIQEMKEKIDACRMIENRAVEHLEVSRELSKSLVDNGLEEKGFSNYKNTLSEIWGLQSTPVDVKGLALKLEHTQHELASLDQEYEQLKYDKQEVESKLEMTIKSNKELFIQNDELRKVKEKLDSVSDDLDSNWQKGNLHIENLEIQIKNLTEEIEEYKKQIEVLVAENNFYSQENKDLKNQKLNWVVGKERSALGAKPPKPRVFQRVAELESLVAELQSANQSLEWQKDKALAMVKAQVEQEIPQSSEWKVNDIVQILGSGKKVRITGHCSDKKLGHFVCLMPDGKEENFFTGQLRFISGDAEDIPQVDSQLTLDLTTESCPMEGALVEINCTKKGEDKTWNGLPGYVQEIKGKKAKIALQGDYREKWFSLSALKVLELPPQDLKAEEIVEQIVPPQLRAEHFKTGFNKKTNWEDFRLFAEQDPQVLTEISGFSGKAGKKVKEALPSLCADYILRTGDRSDFEWINSPTFEKLVEQEISQLEPQKILQQAASEFFTTHNSPKKLQQVRWETVREYAQSCPKRIDALIKSASANGKENSKTRFCDGLENLCADYIARTKDRSDLEWVPFVSLVLRKLGESNAVSEEDDTSQETALPLSKISSTPILQAEEVDPATEVVSIESKISSCKTVEQLEEISGCNSSNIKDADDAGVIVDIYEIHIERTGEFEKLNWLPESIQDEIYQRLGRGSRPLDFELGEKVRGVDLYSAYCSKAGVVTRLTPGLISVAWEDGKFNTHYAEDLEIIPESLALKIA